MNQNLNKKISIIVPAYNVEKYISKCIESLINQTYGNIEIIIVNDGSKDNTLEVINEYAQKDNRIKVINQENQGVSAARNSALKNVSSDFVMFVDSDDWIDENTCKEAVETAIEENADIVMFSYIREYDNNSLPKAAFNQERMVFNKEEIKRKLHRRIFGPVNEELKNPEKLNVLTPIWGKLYKTDIIKELQFISLKELGVCEDGYFNIYAFSNANKIIYIKKFFYHYRKIVANGSLTQKKDNKIFIKTKTFYNRLNELIDEQKLSSDYKNATDNRLTLSLIENSITIVNSKSNVYKSLKYILNDENYRKAIRSIPFKYLPVHWKVFFAFAKARITIGIYILSNIIVRLIDKK